MARKNNKVRNEVESLLRSQKGISIMTLGVTILILMVLAGITLSMLNGDNGIIDEAKSAEIQTELAKLQESTDEYIRTQEVKRIKEREYNGSTVDEDLITATTGLETTEGFYIGVYNNLKEVNFKSQFGKGGTKIDGSWSGSILDLDDCYAIDFITQDYYYIRNKEIWKASGKTSIAEIEQLEDEESKGNGNQENQRVVATFKYYDQEKGTQIGERKESTASTPITPPQLGNIELTIGGVKVTAEPRGWSTASQADAEIEVEKDQTVKLERSRIYYASYTYKIEYKYIVPKEGEEGSEQIEKQRVINVASDGAIKPTAMEEQTDPTPLPSWGTEWKFRGWTKEDTNEDGTIDSDGKIVNVAEEAVVPGIEVHASFEKDIILMYDISDGDEISQVENGTGKLYRNELEFKPAKIKITESEPTRLRHVFVNWGDLKFNPTKIYEKGQEYEFSESTAVYAQWKEKEVFGEAVKPENYGDYVEIEGQDLNGDEDPSNDWKIFYSDDLYVYLISADYLEYSKIPENSGLEKYNDYSIYWKEEPTKTLETLGESMIKNTFFTQFNSAGTGVNAKATATLLDTSVWNELGGEISAEVIGSPTLELFRNSWNAKYPEKQFTTSANETGYMVNDATTSYTIGTDDELYVLPNNHECAQLVLSSPSAENENNLVGVLSTGSIEFDVSNFSAANTGIRPVMRLKYDVEAAQVENKKWKVTPSETLISPRITVSPKTWTKKAFVSIEYPSQEGATKQYHEGTPPWKEYEGTIVVAESGKTIFAMSTLEGITKITNLQITNVDTTPPEEITMTPTNVGANSIKVSVSATDSGCGLADEETFQYYKGEEKYGEATTSPTCLFEGLDPLTPYELKVEVSDKLGNKRTEKIDVSTIAGGTAKKDIFGRFILKTKLASMLTKRF